MEAAALALELPADARLVPPEKYHLTIAFAGELSNPRAAALRSFGARVRCAAFEIRFDAYEHWASAAVVVAVARVKPAALIELHRLLQLEIEQLGLTADAHPFRPHVTLARKVAQAPQFKAMPEFTWEVNAFRLVHSVRSPQESIYTVMDQWQLLDGAASMR
jgi:RNA 2',3'-cyclic 3'-phosphodiesterase